MALNDKQKSFCRQYLIDMNGAQAACRAGYSAKTARSIANRLLTNVDIINYLNKLQKKREVRTQVTQDRVLREIASLAFNDPRKVFDENGALLPVKDWPDEVAAAISSIEINEIDVNGVVMGTVKKVKFWDKTRNLELAARHLGMLQDRLAVTIEDDLARMSRAELLERACQIRDKLMAAEKTKPAPLDSWIDA